MLTRNELLTRVFNLLAERIDLEAVIHVSNYTLHFPKDFSILQTYYLT
jgi:hypothetical protein